MSWARTRAPPCAACRLGGKGASMRTRTAFPGAGSISADPQQRLCDQKSAGSSPRRVMVQSFTTGFQVSPAVANIILFPLSFISGTFTVVPQGSVLAKIAAVFPVRHFNEAVFAAFDPRRSGAQIAWAHLAVLLAWGIFGLVVALRSFRWEPQRA